MTAAAAPALAVAAPPQAGRRTFVIPKANGSESKGEHRL